MLALVAAACGGADDAGGSSSGGSGLSGKIVVDGSSTVAPISEAITEEFRKEQPNVDVTVGTSGTGGGFTKFCFPVGVGAAIYLEEFAPRNRVTNFVEANISNLAGVPSVVYGLLGLGIFARFLRLGPSLLAGALTLAVMSLPVIIVAAREAIRAVPDGIRLGAYALGATKWQTVRRQVLPAAMPGTLTGTILALSRAIGETAPLLVIGLPIVISSLPNDLRDPVSALPLLIFDWTSRPQPAFAEAAAAASIVLLALLLAMNAVAIFLRNRYTIRW